ncbi:cell envelope-related function transcriptional attenuator common domain protein [Cyanobium gracile PCC 6307]|uniref:Cell envelope-related function transcriptional attenuator common domain protein n=1 Tax=Cyanobium gracile (strain ATCC 27147 / PCC 6307) TaxID=292564 RepID=K9PA99_CYAGP|nr:cell envelope-related function transcriptional attenuator common domain protein [Cyanobium gracile PCC 6307]
MTQAHSPSRLSRSRKAQQRRELGAVALPEKTSTRPDPKQRPPAPQRSRRRPLLTFGIGVAVGALMAGPLPARLAPFLAGLIPSSRGIGAVLNPLTIENRPILVLGRDAVGENTDVMFTVRLDGDITHITQVPRDTFIESPQLGVVKANSLFALGGIQTAKAEVGTLLATPVERYLKVNLDAVNKVAEALGGVEVDVPKRMYYVDNAQGLYIDLYPGRQLLKGKDLEGFLRFRHDERGDLGRMERQRLVMAQVFSKLAQPATIAKLPALLEIAGNDIVTDLSPIEMTQLMSALGKTKLSTQRVPGRLYWHNDLSYWMPDSNQAYPSGSGEEPLP